MLSHITTPTILYLMRLQLADASLQSCIENATFTNCTCEKGETFPIQYMPGYIIGILAAFWALSIICDSYFVPTLEIIAEYCNFSDDVAGATFMAAGGSAPELFTSLIGTFKRSSVGFNTIVGSAVFNVLFVIGACVLTQKSIMKLTAWPLLRDCSYYTISLILVAIFFKVISPNIIEWWEALTLFIMYILYIFMMKHNDTLECLAVKYKIITENNSKKERTTFRARIIERMLHNSNAIEGVSALVVAEIAGNVDHTFNSIDTNSNGVIEKDEFSTMIHTLQNCDINKDQSDELFDTIDEDKNGEISKAEFTKWYLASSIRIESLVKEIFDELCDNDEEVADYKTVTEYINDDSFDSLDVKESGNQITYEQFNTWFKTTILWEELKEKAEEESAVMEGVFEQMRMPDTVSGKIIWAITIIPLTCFWLTIPDVTIPSKQKYCVITFIMSILWIGIVSYWMVDWATLIGNTIGIPENVMGLTILAMGTSIPDLISSVIVARQGKGDMAISSSIGSNIFDVLVGLPIPWLSFAIYYWTSVNIISDNLAISLMVLILMLVAVVISIWYCNWETKRQLAYIMMSFYVIFVVQDLMRSSWSC